METGFYIIPMNIIRSFQPIKIIFTLIITKVVFKSVFYSKDIFIPAFSVDRRNKKKIVFTFKYLV